MKIKFAKTNTLLRSSRRIPIVIFCVVFVFSFVTNFVTVAGVSIENSLRDDNNDGKLEGNSCSCNYEDIFDKKLPYFLSKFGPGYGWIKGDKGEAGEQGKRGIKGDRGEPAAFVVQEGKYRKIKGEQGRRGRKGSPGERGTMGQKGEAGMPGLGFEGQKGSKGEPGDILNFEALRGHRGDLGPKGPQGITGPPGPVGPSGPPGEIPEFQIVSGALTVPTEDDLFKIDSESAPGTVAFVSKNEEIFVRTSDGWREVPLGRQLLKRPSPIETDPDPEKIEKKYFSTKPSTDTILPYRRGKPHHDHYRHHQSENRYKFPIVS